MVRLLIKQAETSFADQHFLKILYQALLSTAYYGLFRVGELTSGSHPVLVRDVQITLNKKKMLFLLRTSKTHRQSLPPQIVKITSTKSSKSPPQQHTFSKLHFYPYYLLNNYRKIRGPCHAYSEPFFMLSDGSLGNGHHDEKCTGQTSH